MNTSWRLFGASLGLLAALLVAPQPPEGGDDDSGRRNVLIETAQPQPPALVKTNMPVITPQSLEPELQNPRSGDLPWHSVPRRMSWVF